MASRQASANMIRTEGRMQFSPSLVADAGLTAPRYIL
jgi:hypothetical protein